MKQKRWLGLVALVLTFSMVAGACSDDDDNGSSSGDSSGGELVVGAEQEPDCLDWIASCAAASWGFWTANVTTLPRAFDVDWDGQNVAYTPAPLLDGEPEVVTDPQQVVTYNLSDTVTWNDGTPVTSADFEYTWDQIVSEEDVYDPTGYNLIESVDSSDPQKAVVTFSETFPDWKGLFGGGYGLMPSHILEGKDRATEMTDGYSFSAGPWIIDEWAKGDSITLVRNDDYWGDKAQLDKVTFRFIPDTNSEFQALKNSEVLVAYPQPQLDVVEQINAGLEGIMSESNAVTGNLEALWVNMSSPPLDNLALRQSLGYALDRDEIVKRLFGDIGVESAVNSLEPAIVAEFTDPDAFAGYDLDLAKVDEIMSADGWAKGDDGIWAKDGQRAAFTLKTTEGNARRELTGQIVQEQAKAAGIEIEFVTQEAGALFGEQLPNGDFQVALYANVATAIQPGMCVLMCAKNFPPDGQNFTRTDVPEAEAALTVLETSLVEAERTEAGIEVQNIFAENMVSLPLDPLPNILLWSEKVEGDVSDHPIFGPFLNMHTWSVAS
jgi:peptide/nickel transport system substrate-binding protein